MDIADLIFLRVVEAGSLRMAAEQLGADPSAVSRRLANLEDRLGVKLLERSSRRSQPTEAGQRYYEGMRRLADEHAALEAEVSDLADRPTGVLRVAAPLDFGALFIAPVLQTMRSAYPDLSVEMILGSEFEDIAQRNIDVAVRIGRLADSSLICKKLGVVSRVLVGSPSYLKKHGTPRHPRDLAKHEFVFYTRRQAETPVEFKGPGSRERVTMTGSFTVNSIVALRALVENGAGLHVGPRWAFKDSLASGRLVDLLPKYHLEAYPLHVLYVPAGFVPAKIRCFIDYVAAEMANDHNKFTL